ncbi:MAG: transcriptional regulator, partial [Spirochaetaceae bacterium]|nr:transcriptional regulator [Spirochaetaceae bacterium]
QKALRHATFAAEPGAPIILLAACSEGIGSEPYETWMRDKTSHHQVQETFKEEDFRLGPHKAMLFAADAINRDVYLVSDLPAEAVKRMLLLPAASVQDAIAMINKKRRNRKNISVAILPYGNATIPVLEKHSA